MRTHSEGGFKAVVRIYEKKICSVFLSLLIGAGAVLVSGCGRDTGASRGGATEDLTAAVKSADLSFAREIEGMCDNRELGFSLGGSLSSLAVGGLIGGMMRQAGLSSVRADEFPVVGFSVRQATLTRRFSDGTSRVYNLAAMPSNGRRNEAIELVCAGSGTEEDFEAAQPAGKAALVITERFDADTYRLILGTAAAHSAAALIFSYLPAEGEDPAALHFEPYYSESYMSVMYASYTDALELREACAGASKSKSVLMVGLEMDFSLSYESYASNVSGMIPGTDPDSYIFVTADYDRVFTGYNENVCSVTAMLALADIIAHSGYTPRRSIVFIAFSGSEFGGRGSGFCTAAGALHALTQAHPEWQAANSVHIDITMPGACHGDEYPLSVSTGLEEAVRAITGELTGPHGEPVTAEAGIPAGESPYVFECAGIPSITLDTSKSAFAAARRHTQFDSRDAYDPDEMRFSLMLYGKLIFGLDAGAVIPLVFYEFYSGLNSLSDRGLLDELGYDTTSLEKELYRAESAAKSAGYYIKALNKICRCGRDRSGVSEKEQCDAARNAAQILYGEFLRIQRNYYRIGLSYEKVLAVSESAGIVSALSDAGRRLEQHKISSAASRLMDIGQLRYSTSFSADSCLRLSAAVNAAGCGELGWAQGRIRRLPDIYATVLSLYRKRGANDETADFGGEIDSLDEFLSSQNELLAVDLDAQSAAARLFCVESEKLIAICAAAGAG